MTVNFNTKSEREFEELKSHSAELLEDLELAIFEVEEIYDKLKDQGVTDDDLEKMLKRKTSVSLYDIVDELSYEVEEASFR